MIKVTASGNIGHDAEFKQVTDQHSVLNFSIASNKKVKGETRTTWLNCQVWNREKLAPYLTKGTKVIVHGELEIRKVDDKYFITLNVQDLDFGGSPEKQGESQHKQQPVTGTIDPPSSNQPDDDLPF